MDWVTWLAAAGLTGETITVQTLDAYGAVTATATYSDCLVQPETRMVKVQTSDAAGYERVQSSTLVVGPLSVAAPVGSQVVLADGSVSKVLTYARVTAHGVDAPEHVELTLE